MNKKLSANSVSLKKRYVELITPRAFTPQIDRIKWPRKSWENEFDLMQKISERDKLVVGFKRFVYDSKKNRVYLDDGYVFFRGKFYNGEDAIKIDEVKDNIGPRAVDKIKNGIVKKLIYFSANNKTLISGAMYSMNAEDKFIALGK